MAACDEPLLLTLRQASRLLGISESSARYLAAKGTLPGVLPRKLGDQWRVNRAALMAYVESHANGSALSAPMVRPDRAASEGTA